MAAPELTWADLDKPIAATFEGTPEVSPVGGTKCLWFEWDVGTQSSDGSWESYSGHQSESEVTVRTGDGTLGLSWRKLRPHLDPTTRKVYTPADVDTAPPVVKQWLEKGETEVVAEEFCLQPEVVYWVRSDGETYNLPPREEGGPPTERVNYVLRLSDKAFDAQPDPKRLTPQFRAWTY